MIVCDLDARFSITEKALFCQPAGWETPPLFAQIELPGEARASARAGARGDTGVPRL